MKLVLAIVGSDDSSIVSSALTQEGFQVTKLATTGGFLKTGNTTFLIGTEDNKVNHVIQIITDHSSKRVQVLPNISAMDMGMAPSLPMEVTVGGATIFVLNVEHYEKV